MGLPGNDAYRYPSDKSLGYYRMSLRDIGALATSDEPTWFKSQMVSVNRSSKSKLLPGSSPWPSADSGS
jgi:hypothetical protein